MAKKVTTLTAAQTKQLASLGIKAKSEDDAKKQLIKALAEEQVTDVESEPLSELIDMYEAFYEAEEEVEEEEVEEDEDSHEEEEDYDEVAEEEEEDEEEEVEEDDEEEEEDDEEPKKKVTSKKAPVKKAPISKKTVPTRKAPVKKEASRSRVTVWSKEDPKHVEAIQEPFVDRYEDLEIKLLKNGFTAWAPLEATKRAIFSYDRLRFNAEDELIGDLFFNALKGLEEVEENVELGDIDREFKNFNANLVFVPRVNVEEVNQILAANDLIMTMQQRLESQDKRAVASRKRLEEKMRESDKSNKKVSKKTVKKTAPSEEVQEEPKKTMKKVVKKVKK